MMIETTCFTCKKRFMVYPYKLKVNERCYCSRECMNKSPYKRNKSSKLMKTNNPMNNKDNVEKARKKKIGKRPWNYIDGSSRNRKYAWRKWVAFAKEIYLRDNFTCQNCGKKGGLLNAHHIMPWAGNPELAFDKENVITLCVSCHAIEHHG